MPTLNFFTPGVKKRALVVFTDGTASPCRVLSPQTSKKPRIDVTFVRMGDTSERICSSGVAEAGYRPLQLLRDARGGSAAVHGRVLDEGRVDEAAAAVLESIGTGPTVGRRIEGNRRALMPYVALLAVLPLGFVLLRRNL